MLYVIINHVDTMLSLMIDVMFNDDDDVNDDRCYVNEW